MDAQVRQILEWAGEPERARRDYECFLEAYLRETKTPFDTEPVNAKRLVTLFGNSHFLSRFLIRHPRQADPLIHSPAIETDKKIEDFREDLKAELSNSSELSLEEFGKRLIFYKYREYLRLTIKDLSQAAGLESIMRELSELALSLIEAAYQYLHQRLQKATEEESTPHRKSLSFSQEATEEESKGRVKPCGFSVIAMGKLAGRELNYSSDIDLQYIYQCDHEEASTGCEISHHEYFVKFAEKLTQLLAQKTGEGFLYRVDLNLRPEGRSGTLANSLTALEYYYETFGEEWERQALIKAAPVAGDPKLGKSFLELIHPFVWRKSMDLASVEKIKEGKRKMHESVKKKSNQGFHVKLGPGGIREIEFFAQILQLLYGGVHPELRTSSTLGALGALVELKLIDAKEGAQLTDAYLFLRRLEHRLQMVNEAQTHVVPVHPQEQQALARRMGYFEDDPEDARERFLDDFTRYTTLVKQIFQKLFHE